MKISVDFILTKVLVGFVGAAALFAAPARAESAPVEDQSPAPNAEQLILEPPAAPEASEPVTPASELEGTVPATPSNTPVASPTESDVVGSEPAPEASEEAPLPTADISEEGAEADGQELEAPEESAEAEEDAVSDEPLAEEEPVEDEAVSDSVPEEEEATGGVGDTPSEGEGVEPASEDLTGAEEELSTPEEEASPNEDVLPEGESEVSPSSAVPGSLSIG